MNSFDFWHEQLDETRDYLTFPILDLFYTICGDAYGYGKAWLLINEHATSDRVLYKFMNAYRHLTFDERKNLT